MTGAIQMIRQFITHRQPCIRPEGNVSAAYPIRIVSDIDADLANHGPTGFRIFDECSKTVSEPCFKETMYTARRTQSDNFSIDEFPGADITHCQEFGAGDKSGWRCDWLRCHQFGR